MNWHLHPDVLVEYDQGRLDPVRVMAVDAHLVGCAGCRAAVPVDDGWLARSWDGVLDVVEAPRPGVLDRLLVRCGVPEHRAQLLTATPALRRSWLAATAAVLGFAVVAAHLAGDGAAGPTLFVFLAVAPVLPVIAVATAYGRAVDPMNEVTATTPAAGPALVLWRSTVVLAVSTAMGVAAALLLPDPGWYAVAWLLPASLLSVGTLALATAMPLQRAAAVLGAGWLLAVSTAAGTSHSHLLFVPPAQAGYLAAAAAAAALLIARRRRLDPGEPR